MSTVVDKPSDAKSAPAKATGNKKKNNFSKTRKDAIKSFNPSAAPMSPEKFFTEHLELRRNNVEIVTDLSVQDRVAEFYVQKALTYSQSRRVEADYLYDLPAKTHALVSLTMIRKLLLATPQSEDAEVSRFRFIRDTELMAPKSLISLVDNFGKFEEDKFRGRLKYGSLDVFRMILRMCIVMNRHTDYANKYYTPYHSWGDNRVWEQVDVANLLNVSEASVRWIRDQAKAWLDVAYEQVWEVVYYPPAPPTEPGQPVPPPPEPIRMNASYPRLKISSNPQAQFANVVAWLRLLSPAAPNINFVVSAGLATCWKLLWFQRPFDSFALMREAFPDWANALTPRLLLQALGLNLVESGVYDDADQTWISFVKEIHRQVTTDQALFSTFLELGRQPDNKFGTIGMMYPYKGKDVQDVPSSGFPDWIVRRIKHGAQSIVPIPWADKGKVTTGLIAGFSRDVTVIDAHVAQVNGIPSALLAQYLKSDIKYQNF